MAARVDRERCFWSSPYLPLQTGDRRRGQRARQPVVLRKRCPNHGEFEALVSSDAEAYVAQQRFNKPGTLPLALQTEVHDGCPLDCEICPQHKQHACLGIIEVNSGCNLDCPVCFADSGRRHPDHFSLTREQVARMLDAFVSAEGEPEVVQFSGGEPTIHPDILAFVAMARERGIRIVMINTNGIKLAADRAFVRELAALGAHVYLQFDGLEETTLSPCAGATCARSRPERWSTAPRRAWG